MAILVSVFAAATSAAATAEPGVFSSGAADAFIAGSAFSVLTLLLVLFGVRPSRTTGGQA